MNPLPASSRLDEVLAAGRSLIEALPRLRAGEECAGLTVRDSIDNTSSIGATLGDNYESFGLRAVPMHLLGPEPPAGVRERLAKNRRIHDLAECIRASREITPLIIVVNGRTEQSEIPAYVLEGSHRIDALELLEVKAVPALVVLDTDLDPEVCDAHGRTLAAAERFATPWAGELPGERALLQGAATLSAPVVRPSAPAPAPVELAP